MNKLVNTLKSHKPTLIATCLVLAMIFAMAWTGYDDLRQAADQTQVQPITTISDSTTDNLVNALPVLQPFKSDKEIHGAVLQVATFQKIVMGTLNMRVLLPDGSQLATASHDMGPIRDSELFSVIFDQVVPATRGGEYVLELTANYAQGEGDPVALWQEQGTQSGLIVNGNATAGVLHVDTITNHANTFINAIYIAICVVSLIALIACLIAIFELKLTLYKIFFVACALCGIGYMLVIPPTWAPDEDVHIATAYNFSNKILGVDKISGKLAMREGDYTSIIRENKPNVFSYQPSSTLLDKAENKDYVKTKNKRFTESFNPSFIPTTTGLTLARVLGFNYVTMIFVGRMFNLLTYAAIVAAAIKLAPFAKNIFFAVGMLPMSLSLAASFSYDALLVAFAMLFTSLCLYCAKSECKLGSKHLIALCIAAAFLAPNKGVYVFLCGLCLLIPVARFANKKTSVLFKAAILSVALITFVLANSQYLKQYLTVDQSTLQAAEQQAQQPSDIPQVKQKTEIDANGNEIVVEVIDYVERYFYTPAYALTHVRDTLKLTLNTIQENTLYYAQQLVGGYLSEPILIDVQINGIFVAMLYFMLLCASLQKSEEKSLSRREKLLGGVLILCVVGVLYIVILSWTPIRNATMWGMQGRYLLPILPLALLILQQKSIVYKKDLTKTIAFGAVLLNVAVMLNAFAIIS